VRFAAQDTTEAGMKKQIVSFIKDLKANKKLHTLDEASTKQAVALRLLSLLGWDIFNVEEVYPDFSTDSGQVSYALRIADTGRVFLDVRRDGGHLDDTHKQLVAFAAREAVELAVHTDGIRWWFYLPAAKGALKQKQCHLLDMSESRPETATSDLIAFMSRDKVASGEYLEAAKAAYQHQTRKLAADVLPEAWNKIVTGPNKILMEILNDATEKICGYKAEPGMVERFIRANLDRWVLAQESRAVPAPLEKPVKANEQALPAVSDKSSDIKTKKPEFFVGKSINSFTFQGNTVPVKSWEEMLTTICNFFAGAHPQEFEKVLWLYDDHNPCFSRYSDQLRIPEKIRKTNIYVETKLAPEEIVKTVGDLLTEFGYGHDELVITTH
jgi:predicted type IV restriction endonuclease